MFILNNMYQNKHQDENFKIVLKTITQDLNTLSLAKKSLLSYIQGNFNILIKFLQCIKKKNRHSLDRNSISRGLHCGLTLIDHTKYQAIANYFVKLNFGKNHIFNLLLLLVFFKYT